MAFLGEIRMFAGSYAPAGWALCNGSMVAIEEHVDLYELIGTTYGGDDGTGFALPRLSAENPAMLFIIALSGNWPAAVGSVEDDFEFVGEIRNFPFGFPPAGWAACAGQMLTIQHQTALFSVVGTAYGGDGQTTFALPDFGDAHQFIALEGVYPPRD